MKTIVLAPRGMQDADSLKAGAEVTVIGWDGADVHVEGPARWSLAARRILGDGFLARIPLRLIGADAGTQFARRVRADAVAWRALSEAELIVAADEDAVLAAWRAGRASPRSARTVFGAAAAREVLRSQSEETP